MHLRLIYYSPAYAKRNIQYICKWLFLLMICKFFWIYFNAFQLSVHQIGCFFSSSRFLMIHFYCVRQLFSKRCVCMCLLKFLSLPFNKLGLSVKMPLKRYCFVAILFFCIWHRSLMSSAPLLSIECMCVLFVFFFFSPSHVFILFSFQ